MISDRSEAAIGRQENLPVEGFDLRTVGPRLKNLVLAFFLFAIAVEEDITSLAIVAKGCQRRGSRCLSERLLTKNDRSGLPGWLSERLPTYTRRPARDFSAALRALKTT